MNRTPSVCPQLTLNKHTYIQTYGNDFDASYAPSLHPCGVAQRDLEKRRSRHFVTQGKSRIYPVSFEGLKAVKHKATEI